MITYEYRYGLYLLEIPGHHGRFFARRGEAARLLGRYVRRFGGERIRRGL